MSDYTPPSHTQSSRLASSIADNLDKSRLSNPFQRRFTIDGQIRRGEAYLDGSRILIEEYRPLMDNGDKGIVRDTYQRATFARAKLDASDVSTIQRFRNAKQFKGMSKMSYRVTKSASDRGLDRNVLDPPAVPPPVTPNGPPPHNPPTEPHGAATSGMGEWIQDTQITTLPSGDADTERPTDETHGTSTFKYEQSKATSEITIASYKSAMEGVLGTTMTTLSLGDTGTGGSIDEVPETASFLSEESLATSGTSITSYKTEKTVNSRKSHYNVLPRHKYADHGYLSPQGPGSLSVGGASVPKTRLGDGYDQSLSSPPSGTQPLDGPSTASPITEAQDVPEETQSPPPSPYQGVGFLSANPAALTGRSHEIGSLCSVDVFGSDSEAGAD
jgi:hypothetical protein